MKKNIIFLFSILLICFFTVQQLSADVFVAEESDGYHDGGGRSARIAIHTLSAKTTWITNEIIKQDYGIIKKISTTIPLDVTWDIRVNSLGGDIDTAIKIGHLLREREARVIIDKDAVCASACVFILAGAVDRGINFQGRVGIHRPYYPNDQATSIEKQEKQQKKLERKIKVFLSDMNISELLYGAMLRTSPGKIKMLSRKELEQYGIGINDPYWDDAQDTIEAIKYGLSKREYLKKRAESRKICSEAIEARNITIDQFLDGKCSDNILRGLPPSYGQ